MDSRKPSPNSGPRSRPPGDPAARTDTMQRSRPRSLRTCPSYHQTHASAPGPSSVPVSPIFPHPPSSRSLSSSPSSCSCCSPQHRRALRNRPSNLRLATASLSSPHASVSASPLSRSVLAGPDSGCSTPSLSLSSRARKSRSISFSAPPSPAWLRPPILNQLPLGLPRAPPTLAMSMQIHAPSPIMSSPRHTNTRTVRRASRSRSRPASPSPLTSVPLPSPPQPQIRPPMRPPSRSEKLLRDTLRRAEEYDRAMSLSALPSPSPLGASQATQGFYVTPPLSTPASPGMRARHAAVPLAAEASPDERAWGSDDEDDEAEDGDNKRWLWRSPSSSSSSSTHGVGQQSQTQYPYHYISPRQQLQQLPELEKHHVRQRSRAHSDANPNGASNRLQGQQRQGRSASAAVPPLPYSSGTWQSYDAPHAPAAHGSTYTPHEAVLRSRLEGVLRGAQEHERRRSGGVSAHGSTDNSLASSRNLSEGELSGPEVQPQLTYSPVSNDDEGVSMRTHTRSRTSTSASTASPPTHRRSSSVAARSPVRSMSSSGRAIEPLTPPPSPPFNPIAAAAQCKAMEGYVSFANVGLGVPGGEDEEEAASERRWLRWFSGR